MALWNLFWNKWLLIPLALLKKYFDVDLPKSWGPMASRLIVIVILLLIFLEIHSRYRRWRSRRDWMKDMVDVGETGAPLAKDTGFTATIEGARNLEGTIAPFKKAKQYDRVAEVYASVQRHKEAAKWFAKAGDRKRAATEWARAGYTVKAAKMLLREGDYATAARFFEEKGKLIAAADAYKKLNDQPRAAAILAKAGKWDAAASMFAEYFAQTQDPQDVQVRAADECLAMIQQGQIPPDTRIVLLAAIAPRFEQAKRLDLAARLFYESGHKDRAGEIYATMGKLEQAAACMKEAGLNKEANLIGARHYETLERWAEAGMAYAGAQEWRRAGDCFAKVDDRARAAECYLKAGEFYGAALAYSHLKRFKEAIPLLQHVKETDKAFDMSRALLGRCFYELSDYAHCAATLENHLLGKRVETANVEYFYMLALAYEQLGDLEKSRDILYKIRTVNVGYRDVTQRLSNISSRISMGASQPRPEKAPADVAADDRTLMTAVENLLGGRYRLDRELGRGGMGTVYLARDVQLDRPVALKFLGGLVDNSEEYRQRFIREAKAAARVNHPNIINIYDISASMGRAYIAMEYVEGLSLHAYLREKKRLSPRESVNLMLQACSALDAIHKVGIVHRDIKPDNILIAKGGLVKLTDFGLAKAENARITATNVVMGTPAYMSPEQTYGSDVDARSDIYSMGLVLYEMLTGTTVFRGGDILTRQQTETPPPPSTIVNDIPSALDRIVMKCLAKNPADRFQTAEQLIQALRDYDK